MLLCLGVLSSYSMLLLVALSKVIRHWNDDGQGEVITLKCYYTYHGIEHCVTEDELNESSPQQ